MSKIESREYQSVIGKLHEIMPGDELNQMQPCGPAAVYTTLATVWMMIL